MITKITNKEAIADAGATGHFVLPGTPVKNQPEIKPILINIQDGYKLGSTHPCNLDIEGISDTSKLLHIVPGLAH